MALRGVIFDYGMVLTGPPQPQAWAALERITGLGADELSHHYWANRHAYDEGKLTGRTFWGKVSQDARLDLSPNQIEELNGWDARMWTTENQPMLDWHRRVRQHGLRTAILSNMGDNVHARMKQIYDWLSLFDALVWSYELGIAKPDPAIYRHVLNELGLAPEETLFVDDRALNVEAARELGICAIQFTSAGRLREDLVAAGLHRELPLP